MLLNFTQHPNSIFSQLSLHKNKDAKATKVNHGRLTKFIYLLHPQNPLLDNNNTVYCVWQPVAGFA